MKSFQTFLQDLTKVDSVSVRQLAQWFGEYNLTLERLLALLQKKTIQDEAFSLTTQQKGLVRYIVGRYYLGCREEEEQKLGIDNLWRAIDCENRAAAVVLMNFYRPKRDCQTSYWDCFRKAALLGYVPEKSELSGCFQRMLHLNGVSPNDLFIDLVILLKYRPDLLWPQDVIDCIQHSLNAKQYLPVVAFLKQWSHLLPFEVLQRVHEHIVFVMSHDHGTYAVYMDGETFTDKDITTLAHTFFAMVYRDCQSQYSEPSGLKTLINQHVFKGDGATEAHFHRLMFATFARLNTMTSSQHVAQLLQAMMARSHRCLYTQLSCCAVIPEKRCLLAGIIAQVIQDLQPSSASFADTPIGAANSVRFFPTSPVSHPRLLPTQERLNPPTGCPRPGPRTSS